MPKRTKRPPGRPRKRVKHLPAWSRTLREGRERLGLSVEQAAARVGCDTSTWQKWERGEGRVSVTYLFRVAGLLGIEPGKLSNEGTP